MANWVFKKSTLDADISDTIAAVGDSDSRVEIEAILVGYDATPTNIPAVGLITIESPVGTIMLQGPISNAGLAPVPFSGSCFKGALGQAVKITLTAAGSGITGYLNYALRGG